MASGILIYAEVTKSGYVHPVFFTLAAKAQELSAKLGGAEVSALIITSCGKTELFKEGFEKCGFDKVYAIEGDEYQNYNTELRQRKAATLLREFPPQSIPV